MAEVDTSSYPRPAAPVSALDTAAKLGAMQSQKLDIDQKKLSQANEAMQYLSRSITAIGPNGTPEQYMKAGQDAVSTGLAPPSTLDIMQNKIRSDYTRNGRFDSQRFFKETMGQMAQYKDILDFHLGNVRKDNTGANDVFSNVPGNPTAPITPRGQLPSQEPPTQETVTRRPNPTTGEMEYQRGTLGGGRPSPGIIPPTPNRLQPQIGSDAPIVPNRVPTQSIRPLGVGAIDPNTLPTNPFSKPGERAIRAVVEPPIPARTTQGVPTAAPIGTEEGIKGEVAESVRQANELSLAANEQRNAKGLIGNLRNELKGFTPGPLADYKRLAKSFATSNLPVPESWKKEGGFLDPKSIASQEQFNKVAQQIAQSQFKALGGTGTNSHLDSVQQTSPNEFMSKLGIEGVAALLEGNQDAIGIKNTEWRNWRSKGNGVETWNAFNKRFNDNFDPRVFQLKYLSGKDRKEYISNIDNADEASSFVRAYHHAKQKGWINYDIPK